MHVGNRNIGVLAAPFQRRCDQPVLFLTEITPVIAVFPFADQAIGKIRARNRAGDIETARCAILARPISGKARIGLPRERVFRLLRHDIHHAAGIENAVKRGGRAFQHFHPLDRIVEGMRQRRLQPVDEDGPVAIIAETTADDGILRAAERICLGDAADIGQRIVQRARLLVAQHLSRHHIDRLRNIEERRFGARRRARRHRLITARTFFDIRIDGYGFEHRRSISIFLRRRTLLRESRQGDPGQKKCQQCPRAHPNDHRTVMHRVLSPAVPNRHRDDASLFQLMNVVVNFISASAGQNVGTEGCIRASWRVISAHDSRFLFKSTGKNRFFERYILDYYSHQ
ncbi:hypothetical protein AGR7B_Lc170020 [Agrobacterium deltaense RV3]|nr:hypothetical protein AGR7B_Lc170020 [Agrobacterium deltaense RV3]